MFKRYLHESDLLSENQVPVMFLLNEAANIDIIGFVQNLCCGIGSSYDFSTCAFYDELDEYDKNDTPEYAGLWIGNEGNEEIIVSYNDLYYYLEILYKRFDSDNYPELEKLHSLLDSFRLRYNSEVSKGS